MKTLWRPATPTLLSGPNDAPSSPTSSLFLSSHFFALNPPGLLASDLYLVLSFLTSVLLFNLFPTFTLLFYSVWSGDIYNYFQFCSVKLVFKNCTLIIKDKKSISWASWLLHCICTERFIISRHASNCQDTHLYSCFMCKGQQIFRI